MIPRLLSACGAAGILALAALLLPTLMVAKQAPAQGTRTVWRGEVRDVKAYGTVDSSGNPAMYQHHISVDFRYVQETDRNGWTQFTSRRISWQADGRSQSAAQLNECRGSGSLELGPSTSVGAVSDEQARALRIPCTTRDFMTHFTFIEKPPQRISVPRLVDWNQLRENCSYSEERGSERYTVSVAPEIEGVIELDEGSGSDYARLVPSPGQTFVMTVTTRPATPAYFKFVLAPNEVSRFPGYASNANVDAAFFRKAGLTDLQDAYPNDGPDLLFAPRDYTDRSLWRTPDYANVETGRPEPSATVTVTAMDYGAIGRLRAFVKGVCGGWQPVRVRLNGQDRDYVSIPMDEDQNLIADVLEEYRGDPNRDDDAEPKGNGFAGDGLTAFEEYRGFLVRGVGCGTEHTEGVYDEIELGNQSQVTGWSDEHIRTSPSRKDLFVHTPDPELALMVPAIGVISDLAVHVICEPHYNGNDSRQVNFTLHQAAARTWQGRAIAHEEPQHGVYLEPVASLGLNGIAIPVSEGLLGPPRLTKVVQVNKAQPGASNAVLRGQLPLTELIRTVAHELSHSVGVPHHGDTVDNWRVVLGRLNITKWLSLQQHAGGPPDFALPDSLPPVPGAGYATFEGRQYLNSLLVEPGDGCVEGGQSIGFYRDGKFVGCRAERIARRGQQNSGDFECLMRYSGADYYEPPGTVARFAWTGLVTYRHRTGGSTPGYLVDAWSGRLLKYRNDLDREGEGRLCSRITGTEINGLPGDLNHNGDAGRDKACLDYLVVNDLAARGVK